MLTINNSLEALICVFLYFRKGVEWIRTTNTWTDILNYSLGAKSINNDLSKHIYNFIYKLLESEIYYDKLFCKIVVKQITQPFTVKQKYLIFSIYVGIYIVFWFR